MLYDPGKMTEQVTIQTPPGGSTTDDRDAWGWVDENAQATGTATDVQTVSCRIEAMSAEERDRGGFDQGIGAYRVTTHRNSNLTERVLLYWQRKAVTLQVVDVPDPEPYDMMQTVIARRSK